MIANPMEHNKTHVAITHEYLAKDIYAVVCMDSQHIFATSGHGPNDVPGLIVVYMGPFPEQILKALLAVMSHSEEIQITYLAVELMKHLQSRHCATAVLLAQLRYCVGRGGILRRRHFFLGC